MARLAIRMPKMSMTMTEGEMSEWRVSVGDHVEIGDVVAEVMTDKVDMEVESTVAGTLVEIVHQSGMVDVGEPIAWVEGEDEGGGFGDLLMGPAQTGGEADATAAGAPPDSAAPGHVAVPETPDARPPAPATAQPPAPTVSGPLAAVPRARGLAAEHGLDLTSVPGTGPDGLIRVADVEAALAAPTASRLPAPVSPAGPAAPASVATPEPHAAPTSPQQEPSQAPSRRAAIRAAVARKMESSAAIPQFTVWRELHLDAADATRAGLSWTTVLIRAYAAALRELPELLSRWEHGQVVDSGAPSIALAVATDRGLLVPTFLEPDRGSASDLDAEIRAVVRSAHTGRLGPAYLSPANGSLSNLGGLGVDRFQALLTPAQATVLSLGTIAPRPVAVPGGVGLALTVHAGLTVDHRVADGAHAAELLAVMARQLGEATP